MVKIASTAPGRIVTKEELEAMGLVAAPEPEQTAATFTAKTAPTRTARKVWPDYARTLTERRQAVTAAVPTGAWPISLGA
jgi:hypothetical protein